MLTLQQLKDMKPGIFKSGFTKIPHPWDTGNVRVRWVAVRGQIEDWTIYHSFEPQFGAGLTHDHLELPVEEIARMGAKLHNERIIRRIMPCDQEAFAMYRH